ncbi:hypothetical protein LZ198_40230 [Myxococcus sp. K15C18031901]|uniref:hypothetical protein n=1 Tax=Myxococcus dinghuensis TaxID=2906761 RepID=UPI0020A82606|nr:hypothetical protein [Myxococcus dinghuensis]MCP3105114.1 hypothetical protein [Myxococcus dinghuensis]
MGYATPFFAALLLVCMPVLAQAQTGTCEVQVSGAVTLTFNGNGESAAALSDHWLPVDEFHRMLEKAVLARGGDASLLKAAAEKAAKKKKKGPAKLSGPLLINCVSVDGAKVGDLILLPGKNTRKTLPLKPGDYALVESATKPGELTAVLRIKGITYQVGHMGGVKITRFDARGVAGSFYFAAKTDPEANREGTTLRNVFIRGSFNIPNPVSS